MKKFNFPFLFRTALLLFLTVLNQYNAYSQNGSPCYTPAVGEGKVFSHVSGGVLSGSFMINGRNIVDANTANYATFGNLAGVLNGSGVSVRDVRSGFQYPGGYYAGYVLEIPTNLITVEALNGLVIQTFLDGSLQESHLGSASLLNIDLLNGGTSGRIFVNFKTNNAKPFDEIRLVSTGLVSVLSNLKIFYAMAFDANCGISENNMICDDHIGGTNTTVSVGGGLIEALGGLSNPERITDGDKTNFALYSPGLVASSLLGAPYVSVKDQGVIYPAGNKAGFVIGSNTSGFLDLSLLDGTLIETYLHGVKQEEKLLSNSNGTALLGLNLLGSSTNSRQRLGFKTTKAFNEVRIVFPSVLDVSVAALRIYYAFEEPDDCSDCTTALTTSAVQPYQGELVDRDRDPDFLGVHRTLGVYGLTAGVLTNENAVTNTDTTDFSRFLVLAGVLSGGARVTVKRTGGADYPAGTVAGFAIKSGSSLISAGLLSGITIRLYKDNAENAVQVISGGSLASVNLLKGSGALTYVGGKSSVAFDEIEIDINLGLVSGGLPLTFDIYHAYVQLDSDNDGVPDCVDVCPAGNDNIDSDGDGVPDCIDTCGDLNVKSPYLDTDGDGIKNSCDADSDNDGITDITEGIEADNDGDGIPNYLDLDSDNDGIPDLHESGVNVGTNDADHNGVLDTANPVSTSTPKDSDGDGIPDFLDLDSDNDGITDLVESGITGLTDSNKDGIVDGPDADGDGVRDTADNDDAVFGSPAYTSPKDTDGDTKPDYRDLDSDNDSLSDLRESGLTGFEDADNNGVVDGPDNDQDGVQDSADTNDEVFGTPGQSDPKDTDNDGTPNYNDLNSDGDLQTDLFENGRGSLDTNNDGRIDEPIDTSDDDGIPDSIDNDPNVFGGLAALTDLRMNIAVIPASFIGSEPQNATIRLRVIEIAGISTNGSAIVVNLKKGDDWYLNINTGDTISGWTYLGVSGVNHKFTCNSVIKSSSLLFNVPMTFNSQGGQGKYVFTAAIASGSGGEINVSGNSDQETVSFNP